MPHFTLPIGAKGPILNIVLTVSAARAHALKRNELPIPTPIRAQGLVDTGASCTCIDPSVIANLGIVSKGDIDIHTPSTGSKTVSANEYDIGLSIFGKSAAEPPHRVLNLAVIESNLLESQGFHALIGRDVLSGCVFSYNGSAGLYMLAF